METRANHVWVGAITLLLLLATAAFFVWLARLSDGASQEFDIMFQQSVGGVAKGSAVSYSGVPVGQVTDIVLWDKDPEYVRVRIRIGDDVPILLGTTATVSASFTGVSTISLDGGRRGQALITCDTTACPEGVPVIPTAPGAIGEILASAPLLLQRLATLTDRLTTVLSDENQQSIAGILRNTDTLTGELARSSPQVEKTLTELQTTLAQSTRTLAAFETTLGTTDKLLGSEGARLADQLRATLEDARKAAVALETTLTEIRPVTQQLGGETLPAAAATLRDIRQTSETLRAVTERLETEGAGALVGGTQLPDYEP